jgi:hypothetical protein
MHRTVCEQDVFSPHRDPYFLPLSAKSKVCLAEIVFEPLGLPNGSPIEELPRTHFVPDGVELQVFPSDRSTRWLIYRESLPFGQNHCPLDNILQLANVARPIVCVEEFDRLLVSVITPS